VSVDIASFKRFPKSSATSFFKDPCILFLCNNVKNTQIGIGFFLFFLENWDRLKVKCLLSFFFFFSNFIYVNIDQSHKYTIKLKNKSKNVCYPTFINFIHVSFFFLKSFFFNLFVELIFICIYKVKQQIFFK
jgi:hypothetical protein